MHRAAQALSLKVMIEGVIDWCTVVGRRACHKRFTSPITAGLPSLGVQAAGQCVMRSTGTSAFTPIAAEGLSSVSQAKLQTDFLWRPPKCYYLYQSVLSLITAEGSARTTKPHALGGCTVLQPQPHKSAFF